MSYVKCHCGEDGNPGGEQGMWIPDRVPNDTGSRCDSHQSGNPEGFNGSGVSLYYGQVKDRPGRIVILVIILSVLFTMSLYPVFAKEALDTQWEIEEAPRAGWTIGDPIDLKLIVTAPEDIQVTLPDLPDQWGSFEVSEQSLLEPVDNGDGTVTLIGEATIIPWETGDLIPPAVKIQYQDSNNSINERVVPVLSIAVRSVLTGSDTQKRDLKPQASLSLPGPAIWPWILGGLVVLVLLATLVWWIFRRRRRRGSAELDTSVFVDNRYPEEIAYEKLDQITALKLPVQGEFKRHYDMVTDCIRTYLEGIYRIPAMERTTGEIMKSIKKLNQPKTKEISPSLHALLEEADLVKFARLAPTVEQAGSAVSEARRIVDVTKPDRESTGIQQNNAENSG